MCMTSSTGKKLRVTANKSEFMIAINVLNIYVILLDPIKYVLRDF